MNFDRVGSMAGAATSLLIEEGAQQGDRILLALENSVIARILDQSVLSSGLVRVAVSPRLHDREIAAIAADSEAKIICCDVSRLEQLTRACSEAFLDCRILGFSDSAGGHDLAWLGENEKEPSGPRNVVGADDMAMLMYSSGTAGEPKGAIITHASWMAQARNAANHLPWIDENDVVVLAAPMQHFGGSIGLNCALRGAATVVMVPFNACEVVQAVRDHRATVLPLVPTLLARLTATLPAEPADDSTLRVITYGGSPVDTKVLTKAAKHFPGRLIQFYGLAEALAPLSVLTPDDHDSALAATIHPGAGSAAIVDRLRSAGKPIGSINYRFDHGSIQVRGDIVMPGYWHRDTLTAAVLNDGWFSTGDSGRLDADGYLYLLDRESDLIISGGFNVYPHEVERVVSEVPGVAEVAVVGLPDRRWGEGIHAFIVLDESANALFAAAPEQLSAIVRTACQGSLASFKKPVGVHLLDELPRNPAGKIDRTALKKNFIKEKDSAACKP